MFQEFNAVRVVYMFKISTVQTTALNQNMMSRFVTKSLAFFRDCRVEWCETRDEEAQMEFIEAMTKQSKSLGVVKEVNIQKLMLDRIDGVLADPPTSLQRARLTEPGLAEDDRVERYRQANRSKGPMLITLDTDLEALRVGA